MRLLLKGLLITAIILSVSNVIARPGHKPRLTDEQKQCLESILGPREDGQRPSREQHESAMKQCNISREPHRLPPHLENLTAEQITCLENKLGKPEEGVRPSRDQIRAAETECGIAVPDLPEEQE
ncbi:MAG: hypothetical protein JNL11_09880 [Bdellovibrionaceae bacterium]|nr:hypothetical protein [Pseudobdellovibrionaceae bacterium]